ncbi:unnamed protein product [Symbiodinium necroappetens]|uniref:Uncharacterized protein n=1 Tax=Symbiodinium necroappetens TaxID=1628268 RepID=A0A812TWY6_9DINO|nr:unnamed protein product [Symbiodinium necroappetens]
MDPAERKRQNEALRRKLLSRGLKPGLLEKYQSCTSAQQKFEFLKAFVLDPDMENVEVEACFKELAERKTSDVYVELPLEELRRTYTTEAQKKFLEGTILQKQQVCPHPQDPGNAEMRLYRVYQTGLDKSSNVSRLSTKLSGKGRVEKNAAARNALAESLAAKCADMTKSFSQKELTHDEKQQKEFDRDLQSVHALASKARATAKSIIDAKMLNQEATVQSLKSVYGKLMELHARINEMIFEGESFYNYAYALNVEKARCEEFEKEVTSAETIVKAHENRLVLSRVHSHVLLSGRIRSYT